MANIALLNRCNLRCPYCFADNYIEEEKSDITVDTFCSLLDFSASDGWLGIIGGEPLLHKDFDTIMEIVARDGRIGRVTVFTNGIFIDKHLSALLNRKNTVLINVNSSRDIGKENFNRIDRNISIMCEAGFSQNISLGINVYEENQDFDDFIYLLKKYGFKKIRLSVVIPQDKKEGGIPYFTKMKATLFKLYKELREIGVAPCYDCNAIPECVYTEEEKAFLETLPFANEYERQIFMGKRSVCAPVIDLYPDKTATRCFGCYSMLRVGVQEFCSIEDLRNYFFKEIDSRLVHCYACDSCKDCYKNKVFGCFGGCLCYLNENA